MRKVAMLLLGLFVLCTSLLAQDRTITGRVVDAQGSGLPNASVTVKGATRGTVTGPDGSFSLTVPANTRTLTISSVGYSAQDVAIGAQGTVAVTMIARENALNEVVVTGYTTRRRSEFTGSAAKVSAKQIEQIPVGSFENILQGRAPGLYIASGSGVPGASARVNIRGVGSLGGGSTPLYVLDGVPIETAVFRTLNPNDFESVDVLKDAAGAGLYGSRGANGVIVITTKRGKAGRTNLQYRGQTGFSQPPSQKNLRMMNTEERLRYEAEFLGPFGVIAPGGTGLTGYPGWDYSPNNPRYASLTAAQRATEAGLLDSIRKIDTDWADIFFRNGLFQQHEVNASGGSQNLSFYTSLSYYKQEGVIVRSGLERYTFRGNIDFKTDRLTVSLRSGAGFSTQVGTESEAGVALANPIAAAYLELPYVRAFNPVTGKPQVGAGRTGANAYDRLLTTTNNTNQFKGNLGITAQLEIWNGLGIRTTSGVDWRNNNGSRFVDPTAFVGASATGGQGLYSENNSENLQLITTSGLVYNKTFGKHAIKASAMMEAIRNRERSNNFTGYGVNPALPNTPAGITAGSTTNNFIPLVGGGRTLNGLYSNFLIADYTYNRKITLFGNIRRDVPSQVPEKNRNNIFWGLGGSWNLLEESFMANQNIFGEARIRASYGETANVNGFTSNFGYISTYGGSGTGYAGSPAIVPTSPGNEDYKLESQLIKNVGLDFSVWKRRARFNLDYYVKDSRNLFVSQQVSRTTGFRALSINAGEMRNSGFEFLTSVDVLSKRDLLVTVGFNGAINKNEVTDLGQVPEIIGGTGITRVGLPFGTHYAVGFLGVDPNSGLPVYEDKDGNPTSIYSSANNRATFGTYLPKFTGGASLDASWKGFEVSALFSTVQGVKRFNNESFFYETTNSNVGFNKRSDMLKSWQKPGDRPGQYQRVNSPREFSSRDIQDASFIRFRNLQVGYTFTPRNNKYFRSFRLWGQGQNLYTWTHWQGFDPEESNNIATYEFPNPKTYTLGLDINF